MNLAAVQFFKRAKEVGIRKIIGADKFQIFKQLTGESILLLFIAFVIAFLLLDFLLPLFNDVMNKKLNFSFYNYPLLILIILGITSLIGIISASYPTIFLAKKQPIQILKDPFINGSRKILFRRSFIVVQFIITIALIASTLIVFYQLHYINTKNLGFNKNQLIVINHYDKKTYSAFRNELLKNPQIIDVSSSTSVPPNSYHFTRIQTIGNKNNKSVTAKYIFADNNFIKMLGIKLIEGRNFSDKFVSDKSESVIINETAAKELGLTYPLGKELKLGVNNNKAKIIGVVKDFNFKSFHEKIEPVFFSKERGWRYITVVKIKSTNVHRTILYLEEKWKEFNPKWAFDYFFVDQAFANLYKSERRLSEVIGGFSILAIFIACLGLLGLVSYSTEQRTKEIGVRKVLGASIPSILFMISKEFLKWIIIANIIAWPIAYYFMHKWLQDFAYEINISWWIFALSGVIAIIIALLTVSIQAIKAAIANPVESLRYE